MSLNQSTSYHSVDFNGLKVNDHEDCPRSTLVSKNVTILGRRTSVRLEPEMWNALKDISRREHCSTHEICSLIHIRKNHLTSLTAAIRVFLMLYYRAASTQEVHSRAGHGSFENMKQRAKVNVDLKTLRVPASQGSNSLSDLPQSEYQWMF